MIKKVVIDTNVLVSAAFLHPGSKPSKILELALSNKLEVYFSYAITAEYKTVLYRPKFKFNPETLDLWLECLTEKGHVFNPVSSTITFTDESDRKFYDTAKACGAYLITGNIKHYPDETFILTPTQFLALLEKNNNEVT